MTKFTVVGAGMAGLFAAAVLREDCLRVVEQQAKLPNNHAALLRFRSPIVGDALNIPFRPVDVIKTVHSLGNPVADAVSYSIKTNGTAALRSLTGAEGKIERRYIAPPDLVSCMAGKVTAPIRFGSQWVGTAEGPIQTISTLPMPVLMGILGYEHSLDFRSVAGYSLTAQLRNCDLCATIYLPSRSELAYRASITGDTLIIEYAFPDQAAELHMVPFQEHLSARKVEAAGILKLFGMDRSFIVGEPVLKRQSYAKILPVPEADRKRFMLWATEHHGIYSLGRFATWRPGLLMDDLVKDLQVIQRMARGETTYDARKVAYLQA
jgi:hypothetical protein